MKLSILTATYNREKYLKRLYKSILENQNEMEIEWIIVDDGSTDDTKKLITMFEYEQKVDIKYMYQENSGKMSAINKAMELVTGDLIVDCDSDDFFYDNAFNEILKNAHLLLNDDEIYALCFLKKDTKGNISGKEFENEYLKTTMFDLYFKQEIDGEKILVFDAKIRKKYKHELEKNESFITESRMYHKMDEKYKIICINKILEIGDYIDDGYTKNINKIFLESPKGYYKYFKEILKRGINGVTFRKKKYLIKHFIYFLVISKILNRKTKKEFRF